jgi:hypothetical protein
VRLSKWLFLIAGVYGVLILIPLYFLEPLVGRLDPPEVTHPEYYYGFLGVALAWQVVYLTIATDPLRYRPLIPVAVLAKLSFAVAVFLLVVLGRASSLTAAAVLGDFAFAVLFVYAYLRLGRERD